MLSSEVFLDRIQEKALKTVRTGFVYRYLHNSELHSNSQTKTSTAAAMQINDLKYKLNSTHSSD